MYKLGSLFDGIGGFPYSAAKFGINPVWASEIERAPISITKRHFENIQHLGDITQIKGAEIEPVDIITFGSPCQDLSIAGKRDGLLPICTNEDCPGGEIDAGSSTCPHCGAELEITRSGLFMEAIRIIREMRNATNGKYPTFIIWENVPGAYSSNKGEDFRTVLQEIANVATNEHVIPRPKNGWTGAGAIMGGEFSIAWRTLDAQYWGVPQRRRRIFLVADFGGERAGKVLFERESLSRNFEQGKAEREGIAAALERGFGETGTGYWQPGIQCLRAEGENRPSRPGNVIVAGFDLQQITNPNNRATVTIGAPQPTLCKDGRPHVVAAFMAGQGAKAGGIACSENVAPTLKGCNSGLNQSPSVMEVWPEKARALTARHDSSPCIDRGQNVVVFGFKGYGDYAQTDIGKTIMSCDDITTGDLIAGIDCRNAKENGDLCGTLQVKEGGGFSLNCTHPVRIGLSVRRLMPIECERLQGYPDGWTELGVFDIPISPKKLKRDIEKGKLRIGKTESEILQIISDSARYRACGNSVAIPCVDYVMEGIALALHNSIT